jgi:hypothetical protein
MDPVLGFKTISLPLEVLIGEAYDGAFRGGVALLPHLFYGKQCGLKFKLVCQGVTYANISFVPPNSTISSVGLAKIFPAVPYPNTTDGFWYNLPAGNIRPGMYPVNQMEFPNNWVLNSSAAMSEHEFSIPNVNIYNFIGGQDKMTNNAVGVQSAAGDMGTLIITFYGALDATAEYALFYAFTDETRMGFQVMAPTVVLPTSGVGYCTPYSTFSGANPSNIINPAIYFTNLVTTYNTG